MYGNSLKKHPIPVGHHNRSRHILFPLVQLNNLHEGHIEANINGLLNIKCMREKKERNL